jgi:phosphopantothenate synthetase
MNDIQNDDRYKRAEIRVKQLDEIDDKAGHRKPSDVNERSHLRVCITALESALWRVDENEIWEALVMLHSLEKRMR